MRYIISDTHFGHENIIEYTGRPFHSVEHMDETLLRYWNDVVDEDDEVLFLGDLSYADSKMTPDAWLEYLNGDVLFVRGNHDSGVSQNAPVNKVESCTITHGRYRFFCTHKPPDEWLPGWTLHGHVHNNDPVVYPFIHPQRQTVNVSVEMLDYKPLLMDELVYYLDQNKRYETIEDTPSYGITD